MPEKEKWLELRKEYYRRKVDGKKVVLTDLAKEFDVNVSTLRSRKSRENWDKFLEDYSCNATQNVATDHYKIKKNVATSKPNNLKGYSNLRNKEAGNPEISTIRRAIAQIGNKNSIGNKGGPGGPIGNSFAKKHGFYSKNLPEEKLKMFEKIESLTPLEMIWDNIKLTYIAIIEAQSKMYVRDSEDHTREVVRTLKSSKGTDTTKEVRFSFEKMKNFIEAQARATSELRNLIKDYDAELKKGYATEEQKLRIKKLKAEIDKLSKDIDKVDEPIEISIVRKGD